MSALRVNSGTAIRWFSPRGDMKYRRLSSLTAGGGTSSRVRRAGGNAQVHATRILIPHHTTTIAEIKLAAVKAISNK